MHCHSTQALLDCRLLSCLFALALTTAVQAQSAAYRYINQQAPYTNPPTASFTATTLPRIGTSFQLSVPESWVQRNRVGANFVLATGAVNPSLNLPGLGGYLYTLPLILQPTPMSRLGAPGTTTLQFPLPNSTALLGVQFYQQILEATLPAPSTLRLSRGGHGVIGN